MAARDDENMKCPKCGRFGLREAGEGVNCKVCGYALTPGQVDKYRLFRLLKEESKSSRQHEGRRQ